ncbi:1,4-alpha-glucan branching protein GlgB [Burkholderia multivorans]|uniref:1,4-alpha-glucan branching protein GlgB n=1 Tax=Burkholderia multivorans TaxID=87883 RepID=UPI001C22559A|nr:1,4-alpha-glucan branching protein GlgB [Burkholderia multivorans]MBU9204063.1 1,4-alpha-glucan branching protein GlgB [Burkholderia multivorans]MBU9615470.1 1,4-alpha-glucan branching protein GlgB [Burkholderia multivorans]MCA8388965.1 1,4-alpha-glucan branching protein GlgB [Burkholderia multivorans]MCO8352169.1 1,4-alpha-glucan branching protein GlgB [Burkholderia multivorans]MCO8388310.1 1,4-alpha-glucan branching protein GlgB [Burkholderia multivorans]
MTDALFDRADIDALLGARHPDPFACLGPHAHDGRTIVRALLPGAEHVRVLAPDGAELGTLARVDDAGCFAGALAHDGRYRLAVEWPGARHVIDDPYAFGLLLDDAALARFAAGNPFAVLDCLGAVPTCIDGVDGVRFAVWAPNAQRVSVVGDFNAWDGRRHPMRLRLPWGVWELFVPGIGAGERYKYELRAADGRVLPHKADPCARATEAPPRTASIVADTGAVDDFAWHDHAWLQARAHGDRYRRPWSIYEVHPESWQRYPEQMDRNATWDELAERLIPYVRGMGFTHVEFMPIAEYPFGGSWGYQPLAQFAPSARFGPPEGFARFVDRAHAAGIGVLVDWVPAHFPDDPHGLAQFDGSALYEHADPREGMHPDWHTCVFNVGRNEVGAFLIASALAWARRYHVDGIRVDAVASMLYRDYSRAAGEWVPNIYGGRENLESVAFLRALNDTLHGDDAPPGVVSVAEESTAWPGVTAPTRDGGLGFDFKWNMGWMHDTLAYLHEDPVHRRYHHDRMTFGLVYAFSERFVLPLSHDEVVHGKGSLASKMPGDAWQRLATLRAYFGFMWAHPGKKLLFMGSELAQWAEFAHDGTPHWDLLDAPAHRGVQRLVRDLNRTYAAQPALHALDCDAAGFAWLIGDDRDNSVFAFARRDDAGHTIVAVCNFTPVPRTGYRVGLPAPGAWRELMNTDAAVYGGTNAGNDGAVWAEDVPAHGEAWSATLRLPPLATLWLSPA